MPQVAQHFSIQRGHNVSLPHNLPGRHFLFVALYLGDAQPRLRVLRVRLGDGAEALQRGLGLPVAQQVLRQAADDAASERLGWWLTTGVGVTGVNTLILLASALTMRWGVLAARRGDKSGPLRWLSATAGLGTLFLLIQGYEWLQLIHFGLTVSSSVYGALFYTIIGFHALHVFGALIWLMAVWAQARRGRFTEQNDDGLQVCGMYWTFVVALWPLLYGLVYLY